MTGAVEVVTAREIAGKGYTSIDEVLRGTLAGVSVMNVSGRPGAQAQIRIRGVNSLTGNMEPMWIVDGMPMQGNLPTSVGVGATDLENTVLTSGIGNISPDDVESITILKDAAAAAIYGYRAANGVIVIKTKRGRAGKSYINVQSSFAISEAPKNRLEMMNSEEKIAFERSLYEDFPNATLRGRASLLYKGIDEGTISRADAMAELENMRQINTDWFDEIFRVALNHKHVVTLSGGSETTQFYSSINYSNEQGVIPNNDYKHFGATLKLTHDFNRNLRILFDVSSSLRTEKSSASAVNPLYYATFANPYERPYDENGNYYDAFNDVLGDAPNMARLLENEKQNKHDYWRIFGNAFLEIEPIKNLVLKTNFGMNYYDETNKTFEPAWARDEVNKLTQSSNKRLDWVWTNTVTYSKAFGKNNLTALLGTEAKKNHSESMFGYGTGLAVEDEDYIYLDGVTAGKNVGAGASNYGMVSYFGKVNYDYEGRYLASVTVRRDASSRLAKGNNVDYFPSVSAGWRISSEKFMEATKNWLADLKLRASWGINGNDIIDNEAPYTKYLISLKDASYNMNGDGTTLAPGGYKVRSTNPDLKWESTRQLNIGVDAAFLNGRLSASLDYFDKKTSDMLVEKPYIAVIGEGGYCWYNGGTMNNKGFEMALTWNDKVKDFQYNVAFNLSYYKNEVTELTEEIYYTYGGGNGVDKTLVGQPFGSWMGFKTDGVFRTQQEVDEYKSKYNVQFGAPGVGRIKYVDADDNGTIDTNDRVWLGSDNPKVIAGLNLGASWKGFDLSMFFNGMIRDAYNNSKYYTDLFQCWTGNHSTRLLDAMHAYENFEKTGVYNSSVPALTTLNSNNEHEVSEFYIENGSYIKLKSLTLGYTLPKAVLDKMKMRHARIYFQAQNLFTITGYTGADPEGLGYPYPLPRTFSLGLSFGF